MPSPVHASDFRMQFPDVERKPPQRAGAKRHLANSCQVAVVRERIFRDWLRGVPERTLSVIYELTREAVENILRDQTRVLATMARQAAVATALLLCGLSVEAIWDYARGYDEPEVCRISRARGKRSKRRGIDDGYRAREWRVEARIAA